MQVLLQHLPRDSAFVRALLGDDAVWGLNEHLLASVIDHLAIGNWLFTSAHGDGDAPDPPTPVPRPGVEEDEDGPDIPDSGGDLERLAVFFSGL
ncbi:hypothetical protein ACIBF1_14890 [Spirillospora sp. NPDC050679]